MYKHLTRFTIVAAALLLVGAGCALFGKPDAAPSEKAAEALPSQAELMKLCPYDDKDLCKFMTNWKEAPDYRSSMTSKEPGEPLMETSMEVAVGGKRSHMLAKQGGKAVSEFYSIDGTTYMYDYEQKVWWKIPPQKDSPMMGAVPEIDINYGDDGEIEKDETVYERLGKEACGDRQCFKYKVTAPDSTDVQYLWFDDKEYALRKMRNESKNGAYYEMTITPGAVTIEAPTGTIKEMQTNSVDPFGTMSPEDKKAMEDQIKEMQKEYGETGGFEGFNPGE
jgi:hypothetical protein